MEAKPKSQNPVEKLLIYGLPGTLAVLLVLYGFVSWSIGSGVKKISVKASSEYPGDKINALMAFVSSEKHSFQEKNRAVWALGQLGDKRALPVLEKYYTGQPCDHSKYLCQSELKKAIRLLRSGKNITAWIWR